MFLTAGIALAKNVTITLDSAGDSAFVVCDSGSNVVAAVLADGTVIGGGSENAAAGPFSTVSGGISNGVTPDGWYATVGGGCYNAASTGSTTVAGGYYNGAHALASTVGGGAYNSAYGAYGVVPGGLDSHASGDYSFAAGRGAVAANAGAFVWADSTPAYLYSTRTNQFVIRASGGVTFFTDSGATVGAQLAPGGTGWSGVSDRNLKENFKTINRSELLDTLDSIPITSWNMKTQKPDIHHIGPMAQDFYAAFGLGESDTHIGYSDIDGIALASIQGIYRMLCESKAENLKLKNELDELRRRMEALEKNIKPAGEEL